MSDYQLPEVWEAPSQMGGAWGGLNQPTAGARFEQTLPKGDQPFQLYTLPTPNGNQGHHYAGRIQKSWEWKLVMMLIGLRLAREINLAVTL